MEISLVEQCMPLERDKIVELYIKNTYSIVKPWREFRAQFKSRLAFAKKTRGESGSTGHLSFFDNNLAYRDQN